MRSGCRCSSPIAHVCFSACVAFIVMVVPAPVSAQNAGVVRGIVHDSLGGVVSSAHLGIKGYPAATTSDSSGAFRLFGVPSGAVVLEVRRLGYRPLATAVTVPAGNELRVDVSLVPIPEQLAPVQVMRRTEVYDNRLAGFNQRKSKHVGYFVTREKLDQMNSSRFVDALREIPGVSMRTLRGGVVTVSLRGARCSPIFYMDGFPATAGAMDLDMIDLSGVEGIEVYAGMSSIPAEFMSVVGGERCGVIAVWSRPTRPRRQRVDESDAVDLEKLLASHTVYTSDQVDTPAQLGAGSAIPVYPDSLWRAGVGGRVVAEFVVDTAGLVDPASVRIVSTTQPRFASAVASALREAVFTAAQLGGKAVSQVVLLPFLFSPQSAESQPPPDN